jgi:hypothetical protein
MVDITGSLIDLTKHITIVEAKCSLPHNLALNLCKGEKSITSIENMVARSSRGESLGEKAMNQFDEEMATTKQENVPISTSPDDASSRYSIY